MKREKKTPPADSFQRRHLGPDEAETRAMLDLLGLSSLDELSDAAVPSSIRLTEPLELGDGMSEYELLRQLREVGAANSEVRSYIGMGYSDCITPPVIQRNILENPAWYTQYTPYQSEIAKGRLEALLNYQTMVMDLTGMELANASLLDEATAAAEAMAMLFSLQGKKADRQSFFVSSQCHPQTIEVVRTRAWSRGWEIVLGDHQEFHFDERPVFGALLQYPTTHGAVWSDCGDFCGRAHAAGALVAVAADILSLAILKPPGEMGADVVVGSTQRLGMPMGYGGPHAAYFATRERFKRQVPGRIVGVTEDALGNRALRMALQTREQHIRREKATSNICTSQVLPAVVASMYAVHHGPGGLRRIATRIHSMARLLAAGAGRLGFELVHERFFDTVCLRSEPERLEEVRSRAAEAGVNLRWLENPPDRFCISVDETTSEESIADLLSVLSPSASAGVDMAPPRRAHGEASGGSGDGEMARTSDYLSHAVFNSYRSETEMLRYMRRLDSRDLSLTTSMIPLGSCTMKLNATVEMMPISWPEFARPHPFAPTDQNGGYTRIFEELSAMLVEITGLATVSLQPNAGSQGEYAGLLAIRRYCDHTGCPHRRICLIPASAHGTNPASAVMAGFEVVVVDCDAAGNIDADDLRSKAAAHRGELAALMVTYPSTHGVFEEGIRTICDIVHEHGGQVYMDGANMNALVGMCRPGEIGVDVCHLNLHKTFCIPHGGGGPGMGPIAVAEHLAPYLPGHPALGTEESGRTWAVAAAPWSSALVLLISWAYLKLMGGEGLRRATQMAILNANYIAARLDPHYPVLYKGHHGLVAHEAILDLRSFKTLGVEVDDVAKRLMDYGFHAPTVHFPVPGTIMVEPTESEGKRELDRFCEAMISIRRELEAIATGEADPEDNPIRNAPHCLSMVIAADWSHPYSRAEAVTPADWLHEHKFWPYVARVNNTLGDRNLVCSCPPTSAYRGDVATEGERKE